MSEEGIQAGRCPAEKDIKEVWRKVPGDEYSPSIQVFDSGNAVRFNVGGKCVTMSAEEWVDLAWNRPLGCDPSRFEKLHRKITEGLVAGNHNEYLHAHGTAARWSKEPAPIYLGALVRLLASMVVQIVMDWDKTEKDIAQKLARDHELMMIHFRDRR